MWEWARALRHRHSQFLVRECRLDNSQDTFDKRGSTSGMLSCTHICHCRTGRKSYLKCHLVRHMNEVVGLIGEEVVLLDSDFRIQSKLYIGWLLHPIASFLMFSYLCALECNWCSLKYNCAAPSRSSWWIWCIHYKWWKLCILLAKSLHAYEMLHQLQLQSFLVVWKRVLRCFLWLSHFTFISYCKHIFKSCKFFFLGGGHYLKKRGKVL